MSFGLSLFLLLLLAAFLRIKMLWWSLAVTISVVVAAFFTQSPPLPAISALSIIGILVLLNTAAVRRGFITVPLMALFRRRGPELTSEQHAIVEDSRPGWGSQILSGRPDTTALLRQPAGELTDSECDFLQNTLVDCMEGAPRSDDGLLNGYLAESGLFGLRIPRSHGGKGLSVLAVSETIERLASRSVSMALPVASANALGPAELLRRFGTREQRDYWLPRIASGTDIGCFVLSSDFSLLGPHSLNHKGTVVRKLVDGEETIGVELDFRKRYVTLAPVATLICAVVMVRDPDQLLGRGVELGMTCVLVSADTSGVDIGRHTQPAGARYSTGPVRSSGAFIPLDAVIGGNKGVGKGLSMVSECMAGSQTVAIPAIACAFSKRTLNVVSQYAGLRKRYRRPIARFDTIAHSIGTMAGTVYRMDAARRWIAAANDNGMPDESASAAVRFELAAGATATLNTAMDVMAGKLAMAGPANPLLGHFEAIPVLLTADVIDRLGRSLGVFGAGLLRSHPFLMREISALDDPDIRLRHKRFDRALTAHAGFFVSHIIRSVLLGLTSARLAHGPEGSRLGHCYRHLSRLSANFALIADALMVVHGKELALHGLLNQRMSDALSHLFLASAVLKRFYDAGEPVDDLPLVQWCVRDSFCSIQTALWQACGNCGSRILGWTLRAICFPLGRTYSPLPDVGIAQIAQSMTADTSGRRRLLETSTSGLDERLELLQKAWKAALATRPTELAIRNALGADVTQSNVRGLAERAMETGIITGDQAHDLIQAQDMAAQIIAVDTFEGAALPGLDGEKTSVR